MDRVLDRYGTGPDSAAHNVLSLIKEEESLHHFAGVELRLCDQSTVFRINMAEQSRLRGRESLGTLGRTGQGVRRAAGRRVNSNYASESIGERRLRSAGEVRIRH